MKKKFTFLIAAMAAILLITQSLTVIGQTRSNITYEFSNASWNSNNGQWTNTTDGDSFESASPSRGIAKSKATINGTSPTVLSNVSSITVVASANMAGPTLTIYKVVNDVETSIYSASMTKTNNTSYTVNLSGVNIFSGKIKVVLASSSSYKSVWIKSVAVTYTNDPTITIGSPTGGTISVKKTSDMSNISTGTIASGTGITLYATPSTGYAFTTWNVTKTSDGTAVSLNSAATEASNSFSMPNYNTTVNATFTKQNYNVTLDSPEYVVLTATDMEEIEIAEGEAVGVPYGTELVLEADMEDGKMFSWKVTKTGVTPEVDVTSTVLSGITATDAVLTVPDYAVTVSGIVQDLKYIVTYKANGGVGSDVVEYYSPGVNVTVADNAFTYSGHVFKNWNTKDDGEGTDYAEGATFSSIAADVTLYAQWADAWTVTLSSNGSTTTTEVEKTQSITLSSPASVPSGFVYKGWTGTPETPFNMVSTTYTPTANVTLYAVFAKTVQEYTEKTTLLHGSILKTGDDITSSITKTSDGISYTLVPSSSNKIKRMAVPNTASDEFPGVDSTILIGKEGAYIKNNTPFGEGITKFEIYQNGGASTKVTVGVYFKTTTIDAYVAYNSSTNINSWEGTLSTLDEVYDASMALYNASSELIGAKYFWYQVTNPNNSQIAFRITYIAPVYYTRIYPSGTINANSDITITSPTVIPSGAILNMGTHNLTNTIASNLIIEDGGQLITNNAVQATVHKTIDGHDGSADAGWKFIASPIAGNTLPTNVGGMINSTTGNYDLYRFTQNPAIVDNDAKHWENYKAHTGDFNLTNGLGYLYANADGADLIYTGTINPGTSSTYTVDLDYTEGTIEEGWNLIGNPFTCNATINKSFYVISGHQANASTGLTTIAPCTGVMVMAEGENETVTFTKAPEAESSTVIRGMGVNLTGEEDVETIDNAIVSFNEGSELPKFYFGTQNANIYIPMDNEEFAIVSSNGQGEMPVNFRAYVAGEYTITVNPEEVEMGYLHLIDNIAGKDVDLLATPSYTFNARTDDYESRFRLVFSTTMVNAEMGEDFAFMSDGQLVIANEGEATLQVIDVTGRVVATENINGTCSKAINAKAGVYVLRLINGTDVKTQKMVIR